MPSSTETVPAMLPVTNLDSLHHSIRGLSSEQLHWASGYLAGLARAEVVTPAIGAGQLMGASEQQTSANITVLYGSQTGNGRSIATKVADSLNRTGATARPVSMLDYRGQKLKSEQSLLVILSTHGEGDPPDDAEDFVEFLLSQRAPQLPDLQFSVLALGDSSYEYFCETGRLVDERLVELGATRLTDRVECDVDFDGDADSWLQRVVAVLEEKLAENLAEAPTPGAVVTPLRSVPVTQLHSKDNPLTAEIVTIQAITGRNSDKDVRHIEIVTGETALTYQAGDALGVIAKNSHSLVNKIVSLLAVDPGELIELDGRTLSINDALVEKLEITQLSRRFIEGYVQAADVSALGILLQPHQRKELAALMDSHQVIDVLREYPPGRTLSAQEFASLLRPLAPRLYSIASSPSMYADEVHLTVAVVNYEAFGEPHFGAASGYLGNDLVVGDKIQVYIEPNPRFRLPQNADAPLIMIGPGTGVAPFRAFLDEREAQDASGDNWLFFGDRTFADDFLYQVEWQRHLKSGRLTRLDAAFSRDQEHKIYVQHRLKENGEELYRWLQNGACVYVCGDANQMAPDVHEALLEVISEHGAKDQPAAVEYLKSLRRDGRYMRDVY